MAETATQTTRWVAVLFVVLTLLATYPIARAPASYVYFDHPDTQLNMWIMAWDAHALRHDPRNLFNANIFYPAPRTLAYSETLLGYLPIFGPVLWLHGPPALAFNLVLLFSFAASGFAMYLLARHLTGHQWPAIAAGIAYAYMPYRFVHVPQIQLEAMEWFPLAFLCLHLFVERGDRKYAAGLGACVVLEALCCVYYAVFLAIALIVGAAVLVVIDRHLRRRSALITLAITGAIAALVTAPVVGEYARVHEKAHLERSIAEISARSADVPSYLASAAPVHLAFGASRLRAPHDYLFPGVLALLLAIAGAIASRRRPIFFAYVAVGLLGLAASFGPGGFLGIPVYRVLHDTIWFLRGLRQVSRFGVLVLFAIAVLVAGGCTAIEAWLPRHRAGLVKVAVVALMFLETFSAPLRDDRPGGVRLTRVPAVPPQYTWLAQQPGSFAVLELPLPHSGELWRNATYVYWSTVHWHPLVNGYSGFASPDYAALHQIVNRFPDELSRRALALRNVHYVVVHWDRYRPTDQPINTGAMNRTKWLRPVVQFPNVEVFQVQPDEQWLTRVVP